MPPPVDGTTDRPTGGHLNHMEWRGADSTRRLTVLFAIVAALVVEAAIHDGNWRPHVSLVFLSVVLGAIVGTQRVLDRWRPSKEWFQATALGLAGFALAAVWVEVLLRDAQGDGLPLELKLLVTIRNFVLVFAALAGHRQLQWLGCGLSLFEVVFAASLTSEHLGHAAVLVYVVSGVWWLMGRYWDGLSGHIATRTIRHASWRTYVALPAVLVAVAALTWAGTGRALGPWSGSFGGSGGESRFDPNARGGVNDGDALVPATETAASFGPVESQVFLDSEIQSLYDVVNDMFGDPPKIQATQKAVALPRSLARETEQRVAESGDAGRDFSTMREPLRRPETLADRETPALLYVAGRTPLHLRLEVFDIYDGVRWLPEPVSQIRPPMTLESVGGKPWIRIPQLGSTGLADGQDSHQLKINRLKTNRIPTPWHPLGVHIDRVDRTDFFDWPQESVLGMDLEQIPPSLVIHLQSKPLSRRRRQSIDSIPGVATSRYRLVGDDPGSRAVAELARQWTAGIPVGYRQIEAIVDHLRADYTVDRSAVIPEGTDNSVDYFLRVSRRGPDYLFASSAAVMLRSLGYSTRVVNGFYASPENYDSRKRLTPIRSDDLHFWAEVYVGASTWLEIEPTPGYEQLCTPPDLLEIAWMAAKGVGDWSRDHWPWLVAVGCSVVAAWRNRRVIRERLATWVWGVFPCRDPRERVLQTLRLLDLRYRGFGPPARAGETLRRQLLRDLNQIPPEQRPFVLQFLQCADWAAFGLNAPAPVVPESIAPLCARAAQIVTRRIWANATSRTRWGWIVPRRTATATPSHC